MPIKKAILGVAGEMAVAAELCRRNMYAQLTLGNQKRADLLVFAESEHPKQFLRIEVKAKQGRDWPNLRGISGKEVFLVLVDYCGRDAMQRPGFYVLSVDDWTALILKAKNAYESKYPERRMKIDDNCLVALDHKDAKGNSYRGHSVTVSEVAAHQDAWWKIQAYLGMKMDEKTVSLARKVI